MSKDHGRRRLAVVVALLLLLVACSRPQSATMLYVDGTRGCKEDVHAVELWSQPGAVPAGASVVASVPHGVQLVVQESATAFGIKYYFVAWEGHSGWLPAVYTETVPPVCE